MNRFTKSDIERIVGRSVSDEAATYAADCTESREPGSPNITIKDVEEDVRQLVEDFESPDQDR